MGWSLTLGVVGETLGSLIQAQWFPHSIWSLHGGPVTMGLPQLLAIFAIVASWLTNILGNRVAAAVNRVISVSFTAGADICGSSRSSTASASRAGRSLWTWW